MIYLKVILSEMGKLEESGKSSSWQRGVEFFFCGFLGEWIVFVFLFVCLLVAYVYRESKQIMT